VTVTWKVEACAYCCLCCHSLVCLSTGQHERQLIYKCILRQGCKEEKQVEIIKCINVIVMTFWVSIYAFATAAQNKHHFDAFT